ncbi:hypothetical protein LEP1GSC037_4505 [Leptospira interrogans str. 2006001854]|uniref:Uncharacterized protein n=1 Tax=Leptospira interrogans str. 2006001854 TaxID=1001590 RepID=M6GJP0_LEPIR|nr:hypothetical protein LEP1GSC037_4505 [Leptospira interrogans str. 2006001854]
MFQEFLFFFESFDKNLKRLQINIHQTTQIFKLSNSIFFTWKKIPYTFFYLYFYFFKRL